MTRKRVISPSFFILALSFCLAACGDSAVTDQDILGPSAIQNMGFVRFGIDSTLIGTSTEERKVISKRNMEAAQMLHQTLADVPASAWEEADQRIHSLLRSIETNGPAHRYIEGLASAAMLRVWLLPLQGNTVPEEAKAASARWVQVLIERDSPEAELIAEGIEFTGDYWSESQRADLALRAADAARAYVERQTVCTDCGESSPTLNRVPPADPFLLKTERAIERLQEIATE